MGVMLVVVCVVGLVLMVRSLRAGGCVGFVLWLLVGLAATWFALQFVSGLWRL